MIISSFLCFSIWFFHTADAIIWKKPTHRIYFRVRALVTRCHLNYKGTIPLYISALSNNKLHCKVCAPNFHCFKFIFKISPLSLLPTTCSQSPQAPWRSKIVTFLIYWEYYMLLFYLCQDFFMNFFQNRGFLRKFSPKSERYSLLLHRLI